MSESVCRIIAVPHGAGKMTFAISYLPEYAHCHNFVNADLIAGGLSPLAPQREWLAASRLLQGDMPGFPYHVAGSSLP